MQTIAPLSSLPAITNPVLIDGYIPARLRRHAADRADGSQAGGGDGLTITGSDVTVRGLDINSFSQGAGIHITGTGATGDWIYGNFLGTDPTGTQAEPNNVGVEIDAGATNNLIGTNGDGVNDAAERNLLSGNCSPASGSPGKARMATPSRATSSGPTSRASSPWTTARSRSPTPHRETPSAAAWRSPAGASGNRIGTDGNSVDDVGERNVIAGSGNDGDRHLRALAPTATSSRATSSGPT